MIEYRMVSGSFACVTCRSTGAVTSLYGTGIQCVQCYGSGFVTRWFPDPEGLGDSRLCKFERSIQPGRPDPDIQVRFRYD